MPAAQPGQVSKVLLRHDRDGTGQGPRPAVDSGAMLPAAPSGAGWPPADGLVCGSPHDGLWQLHVGGARQHDSQRLLQGRAPRLQPTRPASLCSVSGAATAKRAEAGSMLPAGTPRSATPAPLAVATSPTQRASARRAGATERWPTPSLSGGGEEETRGGREPGPAGAAAAGPHADTNSEAHRGEAPTRPRPSARTTATDTSTRTNSEPPWGEAPARSRTRARPADEGHRQRTLDRTTAGPGRATCAPWPWKNIRGSWSSETAPRGPGQGSGSAKQDAPPPGVSIADPPPSRGSSGERRHTAAGRAGTPATRARVP